MKLKTLALLLLTTCLFSLILFYGETGLTMNETILWQIRFPKAIACLLSGGILATAGLLMQIFFQNPLAGPDILGVSSGSSLFVAIWLMAANGLNPFFLELGVNTMSFLGAICVFLILLFFIHRNLSKVSLIIVGLLISSFASSGISVLVNLSQVSELKSYLLWSMGSFRSLTTDDLPKFVILSMMSLVPVFFFQKSFNQFILSENYAKSMGVNIKKVRFIFVTLAAFQISVVTLFCGPIGFIGIIAPHLARHLIKKSQLNIILMTSFLIGAILAFVAEFILILTPSISISANAVLGLFGAPLIIFFLYRQKEWSV